MLARRALTETHAPGALELPGGGEEITDQRNFIRILERELREEIGLPDPAGADIRPLNSFKIEYRGKISSQVNFLVTLQRQPALRLSSEIEEIIWLQRDTILNTVHDDPLHSPGEMAAILTYLTSAPKA